MIPIPLAWAIGRSSRDARVIQAVVVMDKAGVHIERRENSLPQIHRIDSETDATDSAFLLQFHHRLIAFREGPLRVFTSLVFDIVNVNQIEIFGSQSFCALLDRLANPGTRVVKCIFAISARLCVFARPSLKGNSGHAGRHVAPFQEQSQRRCLRRPVPHRSS